MSYIVNDWYSDEKYAWRIQQNERAGIPMLFYETLSSYGFPLSIIGLDPSYSGPVPMMIEPYVQPEPAVQGMFELEI